MRIYALKDQLKLFNDGQLSLFTVGTGSAFAKKNFQNNILVIKETEHVLIDCGTRASDSLAQVGLKVTDIKNYYITHSHADHIGGLEEVMLMGRYVSQEKPNIIISKIYEDILWNESLRGGASPNEKAGSNFLAFNDLWNTFRPRDYSGLNRQAWEIEFGKIHFIFFRTKHYPDSSASWQDSAYSTGIIIDKRVLFTADTRFDPELIVDILSKFKIEIIFHDVQFFTGGIHASLDELRTLPASIRARTLLMHYSDNYEQFSAKVKEYGFMGYSQQHCFYDFD